MKKFFLLIYFSSFISSELILEITQGTQDPYRVAVIKFNGDDQISSEIDQIIKNNLIRTGEFNLFDNDDLLSIPNNEDEIIFNDFRILNIDYLIIGGLASESSNIKAEYQVFDIKKGSKVRSSTVYGIPNKNRQLAHYISDGIYEEITGIQGIASTKILYVTQNKDYRLVVADADGKNEQILLESSEPIISPSWSPDSKKVAYVSFETGMAKVFIQDIASGDRELVIENSSQISSPAWSPDGKFLSLTMYQDGNAEIYILNLKNKNLTRLTNHYAIDTESTWSKKGSKIMFTSGRSGSPQLYEINLRKSNARPRRITFDGNYNAKGTYLPNNEGIVFVHRADVNFQIALKYFDENFIRPLTESQMDESPSISPNGNVIVYSIKEEDLGLLSGVTLSGAKFKLPATEGSVREPAWSGFLR
ncbi:MAG: Tol-Pal system beta propeller repeat protein TolB [Gammaproteobacteria bacterium]|tara:strand:+ start:781 stop:2037 length:1257 start_codon:yes stop_codon:yes gene_type:complete